MWHVPSRGSIQCKRFGRPSQSVSISKSCCRPSPVSHTYVYLIWAFSEHGPILICSHCDCLYGCLVVCLHTTSATRVGVGKYTLSQNMATCTQISKIQCVQSTRVTDKLWATINQLRYWQSLQSKCPTIRCSVHLTLDPAPPTPTPPTPPSTLTIPHPLR